MAYVIMETKKFHTLLPASRSTRKTSGVIQSKSEGLRTRSAKIQGQEKMPVPARTKSRFSSLHHIALYRPSAVWMMPTLLGVLVSRNIPSREKWRRTFGARETDLAKGGGLEGRLHIES